jgi:hypothetical protein
MVHNFVAQLLHTTGRMKKAQRIQVSATAAREFAPFHIKKMEEKFDTEQKLTAANLEIAELKRQVLNLTAERDRHMGTADKLKDELVAAQVKITALKTLADNLTGEDDPKPVKS